MSQPTDEIRLLLERLDELNDRFLGEVEAMSAAQREFHHEPGAWSPLQVAQHLMISQRGTLEAARRRRGDPERRRRSPRGLGYRVKHLLIMWLVVRLGLRVKAPSKDLEPKETLPFEEVKASWRTARDAFKELVEAIPPEDYGHDLFRHPFSGPLDVRQGLEFTVGHVRHHLEQIERVRRHEGFARV